MFAYLLLVVIFSFSLPFYGEAQVSKCDETWIKKIYDYWNKNGGVPQRLIERVSTMTNQTDINKTAAVHTYKQYCYFILTVVFAVQNM